MSWVIEAIMAGVTAFAATNIDDIVILTLFFSRVDGILRRRHIITGQYLGFLVILLLSLPGFVGGLLIPKLWLGWLGLLPIAIGLHQLFQSPSDEVSIQATPLPYPGESGWRSRLTSVLSPQTYQVAAVTFANGGDNIAIYVPLFAHSTLPELLIILGTFLIMITLWCAIALSLAKHPLLSQTLTRYGHRLVPFVLIGLGLFIFFDSKTYQLFGS
jgi:cadmium resistance transport/sequestration family protein